MFYNNEPFQWNTSAISDPNGFSYNSVNHNHTANGKVKGVKVTGYVKAVKPRLLRWSPSTNGETSSIKVPDLSVSNVLNGFNSIIPTYDSRKLLIDKARSVIQVKLEEMKSTSKAEKNGTTTKKILTVPNPDFHDFDSDRSEEVFQGLAARMMDVVYQKLRKESDVNHVFTLVIAKKYNITYL
ncbi:dnaJ domain-containing protein [Artemisia annua]|uniref:DnaJ domain-containing protein n=1 Tax=Artemisia annua TaxID=35608 RepID=A0A2U1KBT2_ARTAN|nr:dnaJ domain-containing protein [Artemisia annua]